MVEDLYPVFPKGSEQLLTNPTGGPGAVSCWLETAGCRFVCFSRQGLTL
jgi:hypothetical protein